MICLAQLALRQARWIVRRLVARLNVHLVRGVVPNDIHS